MVVNYDGDNYNDGGFDNNNDVTVGSVNSDVVVYS